MLARRIVRSDELRGDLGGERLEADVPAIFLRIYRAVPRNDPADVAGAVAAIEKFGRASQDEMERMGGQAQTVLRESLSQRILQARFCDGVEQALFDSTRVRFSSRLRSNLQSVCIRDEYWSRSLLAS